MKTKIVIVEDDPITRMDISEILIEEGYNVVGLASDGFDAIKLCDSLEELDSIELAIARSQRAVLTRYEYIMNDPRLTERDKEKEIPHIENYDEKLENRRKMLNL